MVDEEAQRIRDEVMRAMAEQGEGVEAPDLETVAEGEPDAAPVAMPAWDRVAEVAEALDDGQDDVAASNEEVERLFLAALFDDVRVQSAESKLVQPAQWLDAGLVPGHMTADDWEMFVYEHLEECKAERDQRAVEAPAAPIRTATRTVGVPRMLRAEEAPEPKDAVTPEAAELEDSGLRDDVEREVPEESAASDIVPCDDIVALVGKHSYYLYSSDRMTDAYARWSFLANEDDRVVTFAECVRDESRKYPRPMEALSLSNEPFNLSADEIDELWRTVSESGAYPDLDTVTASNGDVYYFSTEYLTPAYAASLAEWNSVERDMFL